MTDLFEPLPFIPLEAAADALGVQLRSLTDEARAGRITLAAYQQGWSFSQEEHLDVTDVPGWTRVPSFHMPGEFPTMRPGLVFLPEDAGHLAVTRGAVLVSQVFDPTERVRYSLARPEHLVVADLVLDRATFDGLFCPVSLGGGANTDQGPCDADGPDPEDTTSISTGEGKGDARGHRRAAGTGQEPDAGIAALAPSMIRQEMIWTISFGGEQCRLHERIGKIPVNTGLCYVAELVKRPREPIPAVQLEAIAKSRALTRAEIAEAERGIAEIDERTIRETATELRRLLHDAKRARADGKFPEADRLEAEAEKLTSYLGRYTDRRGRPRYSGGRRKKAGTNVQKAIKRALAKIRTAGGMEELATHLEESLRGGYRPCYMPLDDPGWRVGID
jgi:hypothetical protein